MIVLRPEVFTYAFGKCSAFEEPPCQSPKRDRFYQRCKIYCDRFGQEPSKELLECIWEEVENGN